MKSASLYDFKEPVLAIDCALGGCVGSVAAKGEIFSFSHATERGQAAELIPLVNRTLAECGVGYKDLRLIVTTIGPGSFTGLRIGLSTARSLGLALNIPVQGVTTFMAMHQTCLGESSTNCLVILETKRQDFYTQKSDNGVFDEPQCLLSSDIAEILKHKRYIVCGDGVMRLKQELPELENKAEIYDCRLSDGAAILQAGLKIFMANNQIPVKPEPLYLREADVSSSHKVQREIKSQ